MAVKIRLMRIGKKKEPHYRIVAADERAARDGRFLELLGHYDPLAKSEQSSLNKEKVMEWLKNGAQVTETVHSILKKHNIDPQEFRAALKKKKK